MREPWRQWTPLEQQQLLDLQAAGLSHTEIALKMGRTFHAVKRMAAVLRQGCKCLDCDCLVSERNRRCVGCEQKRRSQEARDQRLAGIVCRRVEADTTAQSREPAEACDLLPGSVEKIELMAQRVQRGESPFCARDTPFSLE